MMDQECGRARPYDQYLTFAQIAARWPDALELFDTQCPRLTNAYFREQKGKLQGIGVEGGRAYWTPFPVGHSSPIAGVWRLYTTGVPARPYLNAKRYVTDRPLP